MRPPADTLKGLRDRAILATMLYHVPRHELARLRTGDLQLRQGVLAVPHHARGKSTCKDRWRQVLAEADKNPGKAHLLTLEPGISGPQTHLMVAANLQLLVPRSIQDGYTDRQRAWISNLDGFIHDVRSHSGG